MTATDPGLTDLVEDLARGMYDRATERVPLWPKWIGVGLAEREVWLANAALLMEPYRESAATVDVLNTIITGLHRARRAAEARADTADTTLARIRDLTLLDGKLRVGTVPISVLTAALKGETL